MSSDANSHGPQIERVPGGWIIRDEAEGYYRKLERRHLALLGKQASYLMYLDISCEGVIPPTKE